MRVLVKDLARFLIEIVVLFFLLGLVSGWLSGCALHELPAIHPSPSNQIAASYTLSGEAPVAPMCLPDPALFLQDRMEFVVADEGLSPELIGMARDAVGWWNDVLGTKYLLWAGVVHIPDYERDLPYIGIRYATDEETEKVKDSWGAWALRHIDQRRGCIDGTLIRMKKKKNFSEMTKRWLVYHEVGHALGLTHSDDVMSIMHRWPTKEVWWSFEIGSDTRQAIDDVLYFYRPGSEDTHYGVGGQP